jgi:2-polyprenyl-3-methyl-5-hydroxy-6-metoxy-1,4-benzoquinol methylase
MRRIAEVGFDPAKLKRQVVRECNMCGHESFVTINQTDRYGYANPATLCLRCGLVFLNPVLPADAYGDFYRHTYRPLVSAFHGRLIDARTIQEEQAGYANELSRFMEPHLEVLTGRRLLDVGGSTGVVSSHLARACQFEPTILDPAPDELDCAERDGMQVIAGFLETADVPRNAFDLVICCQTIDHFVDVETALKKMWEATKPGGLFFVDIVDFRAAYLRARSVSAAIKIDHPYYFVEFTAESFLRKAGFEILSMNYAADNLHVGFLCRKSHPTSDFLPLASEITTLRREIRAIENQASAN